MVRLPSIQVPDVRGVWSHHKNAIIGSALIAVIILGAVVFVAGFSTFNVGREAWEIRVGIHGAQVGSYEYAIPDAINTATLPTQVKQASGSFLNIDPDRMVPTDADYHKGITLSDYTAMLNHGDGPLPSVVMDLSQLYHSDKDGVATDSSLPTYEYDAQGLHWEQHFYQFSVQMKTDMGWSDSIVDAYFIGEKQNTYEGQPVTVTMYVLINLNCEFTNQSFKSLFGDAKVVYVKSGVANTQFASWTPVGPDDPANAVPLLDVNAKIDPYTTTGTDSDKTFILALQATLDGGIDYGTGIFGDIDTVNAKIDVFVKYSVRFSVLISRPLVLPGREANLIADPAYWNTWGASIWENFWNTLADWAVFIIIAVIAIITILVSGLVLYKRYNAQPHKVSTTRRGKSR